MRALSFALRDADSSAGPAGAAQGSKPLRRPASSGERLALARSTPETDHELDLGHHGRARMPDRVQLQVSTNGHELERLPVIIRDTFSSFGGYGGKVPTFDLPWSL